MLHLFLAYYLELEVMKSTARIKIPTFCLHHWKPIPAIGVRKYMCTECLMFGFRLKCDLVSRTHEHSVEVSNDLLDQYLALVPVATYKEPEKRSGPRPGPFRMLEYDGCEHKWVPAPEYSDCRHSRLQCTKCKRLGRKLATGEITPFVKEYDDSLRRSHKVQQRLNQEPACAHEWKPVPQLDTKCVKRYECSKCRWLGYRVGVRVPIKTHTVYSTDRIRSEYELNRKDSNGKEEQKDGVLPEEPKVALNIQECGGES